jgi:hypothetical protein
MGSCWRRLKWLVEFAIDYGSIALFLSLAVVFQLSSGGGDKYGESDPGGLFGVLFAVSPSNSGMTYARIIVAAEDYVRTRVSSPERIRSSDLFLEKEEVREAAWPGSHARIDTGWDRKRASNTRPRDIEGGGIRPPRRKWYDADHDAPSSLTRSD